MRLLEQLTEQGVTLIVVTHDHENGERARRQITMVDGKVVGDQNKAG
jgi:putative ABC transport system ATP-binding protein